MDIILTAKRAYSSFKAKTPSQVIRFLLLRTWPLALIGIPLNKLRFSNFAFQIINGKSRRLYQKNRRTLDHFESRACNSIKEQGIFISNTQELTSDETLFHSVKRDAQIILRQPGIQEQINAGQSISDSKWYVIRGLGRNVNRRILPDSFVKLFLGDRLLTIINEHLGLQCRLNYVDLWYNVPAPPGSPTISSEYWHRDHEDRRVIKVFVYLNDVDIDMGPFSYAQGTHDCGIHHDIYSHRPARGCYPNEQQLENIFSTKKVTITKCVNRAGAAILCDTSGFHRGGRTSSKPRLLLVGVYTSNRGIDSNGYILENVNHYQQLNNAARYALYADKRKTTLR